MRTQKKVGRKPGLMLRKWVENMAKKKYKILSVEVGKFGKTIELPDDEQTERWLQEGKIEEKK